MSAGEDFNKSHLCSSYRNVLGQAWIPYYINVSVSHTVWKKSSPVRQTYLLNSGIIFSVRDAPDIRPDNPAFFDIRYPAGYQIALPDIR
jgi:hypothetical protein